jgi:hypothetical protein
MSAEDSVLNFIEYLSSLYMAEMQGRPPERKSSAQGRQDTA